MFAILGWVFSNSFYENVMAFEGVAPEIIGVVFKKSLENSVSPTSGDWTEANSLCKMPAVDWIPYWHIARFNNVHDNAQFNMNGKVHRISRKQPQEMILLYIVPSVSQWQTTMSMMLTW